MPLSIEELSEQFQLRLLRHERKAASQMVQAYYSSWQKIKRKLELLEKERKRLLKAGDALPQNWFYQNRFYTNLLSQVKVELEKYAGYAEAETLKLRTEAILFGLDDAEALTYAALGQIPAELNLSWNRLNVHAVERMVGITQPGTPLHALFSLFGVEGLQAATTVLQDALILGQGPRAVARALRDALGISLTRALTISRTEILRAYRIANLAGYRENPHLVKQWRWMATLDGRTCASCFAMHGKLFDMGVPFESHPNCRCTPCAETYSWREIGERYGLDLSKLDEQQTETIASLMAKGYSEQDARSYLLRTMTGEKAFGTLDAETQKAILGKAKYLAWKDGKFEFSDLSVRTSDPVWGAGRKVASLRELLGADEAKYLDLMRKK